MQVYYDSCTLSCTGGLKLIDEDLMLVFASCSGCSRMLDVRRTTRGEGGARVVEVICTVLYAAILYILLAFALEVRVSACEQSVDITLR